MIQMAYYNTQKKKNIIKNNTSLSIKIKNIYSYIGIYLNRGVDTIFFRGVFSRLGVL